SQSAGRSAPPRRGRPRLRPPPAIRQSWLPLARPVCPLDAEARRMRAFTRAVSRRLAECQLTHLERVPIDPAKAAEQHAAYEVALAGAGFEIVRLPELADDPDAVFVEDT